MFSQHEKPAAAERSGAIVVRRVHAPVKSGFKSLDPKQFTYFSGTGVRESFGMPCNEYAELISRFYMGHRKNEEPIRALLALLNTTITKLADDLKQNLVYNTTTSIADALLYKTGHIPIMLSQIMPAAMYKRSARSLQSYEIAGYFSDLPGAAAQAKHYLVKHDMTEAVKNCLDELYKLRYTAEMESETTPLFYACNMVIKALSSDVIDINQSTMPANCAQFDLFSTFCENIHRLICQCDPKSINKVYLDRALAILNRQKDVQTFNAQKDASQQLYSLFEEIIAVQIGIKKDAQEINLTPEQDKMLQAILPLIAYLNSEHNPFARAGLYGKELRNAFIEEALHQYEAHESKETWSGEPFIYSYRPETYPREYDEDQIDHLLYGPESVDPAPQAAVGMLASMGRALAGFLTSSATSSRPAQDGSVNRGERLALPMPEKYLALEAPPATKPETDQQRP